MSDLHADSSFHKQSVKIIVFKMTDISSKNQEFVDSLVGNTNGKINAKLVTFTNIW